MNSLPRIANFIQVAVLFEMSSCLIFRWSAMTTHYPHETHQPAFDAPNNNNPSQRFPFGHYHPGFKTTTRTLSIMLLLPQSKIKSICEYFPRKSSGWTDKQFTRYKHWCYNRTYSRSHAWLTCDLKKYYGLGVEVIYFIAMSSS